MSELRIWVESPTHVDHGDTASAFGCYMRLAGTDVRELLRDADTESCEKRPAVTQQLAAELRLRRHSLLLYKLITCLNSIISTATDTNPVT